MLNLNRIMSPVISNRQNQIKNIDNKLCLDDENECLGNKINKYFYGHEINKSKTRRIKSTNNSNSKNKFKSYLPSKDVVKEFSKIVQNKLNRIRNATPLRDNLNIN